MNGAFRQSMTWLHTWSGIVVVWLLYFMFVTGTIGYFDDEVDRWMKPEQGPSAQMPIEAGLEAAQTRLEDIAAGADRWFIYPTIKRSNPHLSTFWQMPTVEGEDVVRGDEELDPTTAQPFTPAARDTGGGQVLYRMHYLLHYLPGRSGYYIMAIVTMFMFVGLMTGVVAHKKIFKDFFTFRWARGQRSWLDLHNLASVATLPFQFMITYSGLLFTLALFWMPFVVLGGYGFDIKRISALAIEFQGQQAERSGDAVPLVRLATLAQQIEADWGPNQIAFVRVEYPGDANARVTFQRETTGRTSAESVLFDGASGERLTKPAGGLDFDANPAFGFAGVMFSLHEGQFADTVLRWVYFLSGLLGTIMIGTGAIYWVEKRRPRRAGDPTKWSFRAVERANVAVIAGLIGAVGVYLWANRLLPVGLAERADWEVHCMFLAWLAFFAHAALRRAPVAWIEQCTAVGLIFLAVPIVNGLTTSAHLGNSIAAGDWVLAGVDLTAIATGLIALGIAHAMRARRSRLDAIDVPALDGGDAQPQLGG
ncbi:MAG: PepSY-associated TM helix domain-containing protein [Pseudomonadota bacterium]